MTLSSEIQDNIKTYLWEVASHLHAASPASRTEILRDVESHIHEALLARNPEPTAEDLNAVLSSMPKPVSYAIEAAERPIESNVPETLVKASESFGEWLRRFTWQSVAGPLLLLLGVPLFIKGVIIAVVGIYASWSGRALEGQWGFNGSEGVLGIVSFVFLLLGIIALICAREVGRGGVDRIRNSDWHLYGFFGAYVAYLVPELLLITIMLGGLIAITLTAADCPILLTIPIALFVLGTIFYFIIKYRWIRLSRRNDTPAGIQE